MSTTPQNPAGHAGVTGGFPIRYSLAQGYVDATSNLTLLNMPKVQQGILKMFPERDMLLPKLMNELVGEVSPADANALEWYNTFYEPINGVMKVNAHAASAVGGSVTITLGAGSYINGAALAFENYVYYGYSSVTGSYFEAFARVGGVNNTVANAWTVTLFPTDLTGTVPAQSAGDALWCAYPTVAEGNTTHSAQGRFVPAYSTKHNLMPMAFEGVKITDLAAFTNDSWIEGNVELANGTSVSARYWWNVEIQAGVQEYMRGIHINRLMNEGNMLVTDANARYSSIGIIPFVRDLSGNAFVWNGTTISDADVVSWIDSLKLNYEGVSEYVIVCGQNLQRAIQAWINGPHIVGGRIEVDQAFVNLDFTKFKWYNTTFYIPVTPLHEFDNAGGMGALGFSDNGLIIPKGRTSTSDGLGQQRKFLNWKVMGNGQTVFNGAQGTQCMYWKGGPQFFSKIGMPGDEFFIPTQDATAEVGFNYTEGSDHIKPYMFGWISL